ncbi:hypothetical protein HK104_005328, partial [Borealophlyctis nickersoniae]
MKVNNLASTTLVCSLLASVSSTIALPAPNRTGFDSPVTFSLQWSERLVDPTLFAFQPISYGKDLIIIGNTLTQTAVLGFTSTGTAKYNVRLVEGGPVLDGIEAILQSSTWIPFVQAGKTPSGNGRLLKVDAKQGSADVVMGNVESSKVANWIAPAGSSDLLTFSESANGTKLLIRYTASTLQPKWTLNPYTARQSDPPFTFPTEGSFATADYSRGRIYAVAGNTKKEWILIEIDSRT